MNPPGLLVTGTDTDVGKTYVSVMIIRDLMAHGISVGAYKPVCSGSVPDAAGIPCWHDVDALSCAVGGGFDSEMICPQRFTLPLAPPVAARAEGRSVDTSLLREGARRWSERVDFLVVEGVGGLLCPVTEEETVADLAYDLRYPLIVVSRLGLGTINHTLLTIEVARQRGLTVAGIVMNQATPEPLGRESESNPAEIARRCEAPLLGLVRYNESSVLAQNGRPVPVDWQALAIGSPG
jgi:dethiobiotin synthetase